MKAFFIIFSALFMSLSAFSQNVVYKTLDSFVSHHGDTISTLTVLIRSGRGLMLVNGGKYKILSPNKGISKYIRSKCIVVLVDSNLYINCRKLSYERYKFGKYFEKAYLIKGQLYFASAPLGQIAALSFTSKSTNKLNGTFGDAIAASCLSSNVIYQLDPLTGVVHFISREKLVGLIPDISAQLRSEILSLGSDDANILFPFLQMIK